MSNYSKISTKLEQIWNKDKSEEYLEFQRAAWNGDIIKLKQLNFPIEKATDYELLNIPLSNQDKEVIEFLVKSGWKRTDPEDDGFRHYFAVWANDYYIDLFIQYNIITKDDFKSLQYNVHFLTTATENNNIDTTSWILNQQKFSQKDIKSAIWKSACYGANKTFQLLVQKYKESNPNFKLDSWKLFMNKCLNKAIKNQEENVKPWRELDNFNKTIFLIKNEMNILLN